MTHTPQLTLLSLSLATTAAMGQSNGDFELEPTLVTAERVAEDTSSDQLVNPALNLGGKLPHSIFETPRAVEAITREEFVQRGAQNLEEAARYTSGVQSAYYGLDNRQDFVRIRGMRSQNYRDGLQYNFNFYNNTPQENYAIEQVDIVKGPASLLFGNGTAGGTVNTVSKIAGPDAKNEIMAGYGSHDRMQFGLDYNQAVNEEETVFLRLVSYFRQSDTYVDFVNDDSWFVMPSLTWQPTEDTSLSVLFNYQENESMPSLQFYPYEATQVPGFTLRNNLYAGEPSIDRYNTSQKSASLIFKHQFNDTYSFNSTLRYLQSSADYVEHTIVPPLIAQGVFGPGTPAGTYHRLLYASDHETDVFSGNMALNAKYELGTVKHELQLGFDFNRADRERYTLPPNPGLYNLNYVYGGALDFTNPNYGAMAATLPDRTELDTFEEELYGIYLSDRIEWNNFIVSLGARYDDYSLATNQLPSDTQQNWSFDAGVMYQFDNGVSPYYSYAESFEPQGVNDLTGDPLKPKEGTQHEIGVKWMPDERTLFTASYFDIEEANRVFRPDPFTVTQSSSVDIQGAEASLQHRSGDFFFQSAFTYLDTANNDIDGSPALAGVPDYQASAWLTYSPQEGPLANFRAGLGARYTGTSSDGRDALETKSHTLVDAMLGYSWDDFDIQLSVSNLFDKQYIQTIETSETLGADVSSAFLGQDRSINLTATYSF
ncbi:TonB-dependent siderophore receptor [Roseibacillus persicicus]|uniref:TonB-dependent siderophore receptor n=1 Tax=Roseibacillus persicicus TaxID=454148 RepID=UPI00398B0D6F